MLTAIGTRTNVLLVLWGILGVTLVAGTEPVWAGRLILVALVVGLSSLSMTIAWETASRIANKLSDSFSDLVKLVRFGVAGVGVFVLALVLFLALPTPPELAVGTVVRNIPVTYIGEAEHNTEQRQWIVRHRIAVDSTVLGDIVLFVPPDDDVHRSVGKTFRDLLESEGWHRVRVEGAAHVFEQRTALADRVPRHRIAMTDSIIIPTLGRRFGSVSPTATSGSVLSLRASRNVLLASYPPFDSPVPTLQRSEHVFRIPLAGTEGGPTAIRLLIAGPFFRAEPTAHVARASAWSAFKWVVALFWSGVTFELGRRLGRPLAKSIGDRLSIPDANVTQREGEKRDAPGGADDG